MVLAISIKAKLSENVVLRDKTKNAILSKTQKLIFLLELFYRLFLFD